MKYVLRFSFCNLSAHIVEFSGILMIIFYLLQAFMPSRKCYRSAKIMQKITTDQVPKKCKTKKKRDLAGLNLCGNNLPLVEPGTHFIDPLSNKVNPSIPMKRFLS